MHDWWRGFVAKTLHAFIWSAESVCRERYFVCDVQCELVLSSLYPVPNCPVPSLPLRVFNVATGKLHTQFNGNASEETAYLINVSV